MMFLPLFKWDNAVGDFLNQLFDMPVYRKPGSKRTVLVHGVEMPFCEFEKTWRGR